MSSRGCRLCPPPLPFLPPVVAAWSPQATLHLLREPSAWESARPGGEGLLLQEDEAAAAKARGGALPERHTFPPFPDGSPPSDYPGEHIPPHKSSSPQGLIPTHLGRGWGPQLSWLCPSQRQKFKSFQLFSFVPSPPSSSHPPPLSLPLGADEPPSSRAVLGWTGLGARTPESSTEWSVLG